MATEKLKFKLELFATMWHLPPVAEIKLNGRSYFKSEISSTEQDPTKIQFEADLSEGSEYGLTIERTGKRTGQTVIDNKGNILKDQLLHIKSINIDEIDIGALVFDGVYTRQHIQNHGTPMKLPLVANHVNLLVDKIQQMDLLHCLWVGKVFTN